MLVDLCYAINTGVVYEGMWGNGWTVVVPRIVTVTILKLSKSEPNRRFYGEILPSCEYSTERNTSIYAVTKIADDWGHIPSADGTPVGCRHLHADIAVPTYV